MTERNISQLLSGQANNCHYTPELLAEGKERLFIFGEALLCRPTMPNTFPLETSAA
jgi:hypothetical protein